jgi:adenosylhomocysteine nucleosidase
MESAVIGAEAAERRIPFAVIRAVSDLLDEDLPLDFNLFLTPSDWSKGIWSCITRPSNLFGLGRMRVQMGVASKRLTLIFERVLDELGCDRSTSHDRRMMP